MKLTATSSHDDRTFSRRALMAGVGGGAVWAGLTARLMQLQIFEGDKYALEADENRIRLDPAPAQRGRIFDRFGQTLAGIKRNFYVAVVPEATNNLTDVLDRLSKLIPISDARKARILREASSQARFVPIVVADDLSWEEFAKVNVQAPELAGVVADVGELRSYPMDAAFAHAVGYVGRANDAEIAGIAATREGDPKTLRRLYKHPDMRLGKSGVELFAEEWLTGQSGYQRVVVNADGRIIERLPSPENAPVAGNDLVLSFDAEIQKAAIRRFGDESGAAVVMDIESGEILALVSTPAFNPNDFVSGISTAKYNTLLADERAPLYHKAYDGIYPPGSTFKMIVAAAALEAGVMRPNERVQCNGKIWFGGREFHCWKREGHGSVNLHRGIQQSCDVYFYEMARRAGAERISAMAQRFGLGQRYPLGMTGGAAAVVPNDAWKRANRGEPWYDGDTLNFGIGQGFLTSTPLQLAIMTARIARGEAAASPTLILHGPKPENAVDDLFEPISQATAEALRAGMFAVTSEPGGTALRSGDLGDGVRLAGKTGTAQVRRITREERLAGVRKNEDIARKLRDHALFVAYAPADAPRYVCSVIVDHGGSGSKAAAPIARDILAQTLQIDPANKPRFSPPPRDVADRAMSSNLEAI